ncbi:MAG: AAA family ATPase [Deltaproteobacteria bacterium]|jgi:hypothetical protein|nr:AAA family ATPase [Deltaproteobacteria bacterium]
MEYTYNDLNTYFTLFIIDTAYNINMIEEKLLDEIRDYYDGLSFDKIDKLYNIFSILAFINPGTFLKLMKQ